MTFFALLLSSVRGCCCAGGDNPLLSSLLFYDISVSDSFEKTKEVLATEEDIGLTTLGTTIFNYLLHDILFKSTIIISQHDL